MFNTALREDERLEMSTTHFPMADPWDEWFHLHDGQLIVAKTYI